MKTESALAIVPSAIFSVAPGSFHSGTTPPSEAVAELETEIEGLLRDEEHYTQSAAFAALKCGALFIGYRNLLEAGPRDAAGFTGFWEKATTRFNVGRATISRRMKLAVVWAKENGASPDLIAQLATASNDDAEANNQALQLAFKFVGSATTTELYRKHNIVNGDKRPKPAAKGARSLVADVEAEKRECESVTRTTIAHVRMLLAPGHLGQVGSELLRELDDARIELGHAIAEVIKARKGK
jgi:hypothetical protein